MGVMPASHQSDIVDTPQGEVWEVPQGSTPYRVWLFSWMLSDADIEVNE